MVSIIFGLRALSSNARRRLAIQPGRTSSVTNTSGQTVEINRSLLTTPSAPASCTSTCIALGSTRALLPSLEIWFSAGLTSHSPILKSPSTPSLSPDYSWRGMALLMWRPRVSNLDGQLLLPDIHRISRRQRLKACSGVVNHIQITVRTERPAHPEICADRLCLCRVRLDKGRRVQKSGEGVAHLHSGQVDIEISLRKPEGVVRIVNRKIQMGVRPVLHRGCGGLELSPVVHAPVERTYVRNAVILRRSKFQSVPHKSIVAARHRDVFVKVQRTAEHLPGNVLRKGVNLRSVVK